MFDKIDEKIDNILPDDISASVHICSDFNIHYKYYTQTKPKKKTDTVMTSSLLIPDKIVHHANLDPLFPACLEKCSIEVLPSLVTSGDSLISVEVDARLKASKFHFIRRSFSTPKMTGISSNLLRFSINPFCHGKFHHT